MTRRGPRAFPAELTLVAAFAAWAFFPVVLLFIHAARTHTQFTGADGLIGAHGVLGADQLQYLAWARDSAGHGLASDLFTLGPSGHVYLEPVFAVIGLLDRAGVPLRIGYLALKALAVLALVLACAAWARRLLGDRLGPCAAALTLSLFVFTPIAALLTWLQSGSDSFLFQTYLIAGELLPASAIWGSEPSAFAVALMPVVLLATERALDGRRIGPALVAAGAALLASWLHPWQGITLVLILVGLALIRRREWGVIGAVAVAAALPLVYYLLLAHDNAAWRMASDYEHVSRFSALVLALGLGPLALLAALGVRRPRGSVSEQALLLWAPAALIAYFANDAFAPHALEGLSIPFAVLAVRGFARLRLPAIVGVVGIGLLTVPGLAYDARKFVRTTQSSLVQYYLPASDVAALRWVTGHAPRGGVLAPTPFATVVPAYTGRAVWVGYGYWSPHYAARSAAVDRLFAGRMRPASAARGFVVRTGARILIADCRHPGDLSPALGALVASVHRFGCARVYVLEPR